MNWSEILAALFMFVVGVSFYFSGKKNEQNRTKSTIIKMLKRFKTKKDYNKEDIYKEDKW